MYIPNTVAQGMLNGTGYATAVGTSPTLRIYSGTVPADADAALSSNTLLATLACAATPFSGLARPVAARPRDALRAVPSPPLRRQRPVQPRSGAS